MVDALRHFRILFFYYLHCSVVLWNLKKECKIFCSNCKDKIL
jgi:hypothetical protein